MPRSPTTAESSEQDWSEQFSQLIARASSGDAKAIGQLLERYGNYLRLIAAANLDPRLKSRLSAADIVQEALLRAFDKFSTFRGKSEPELIAWLRQILVNSLAHAVEQHMIAARRDVRRERTIEIMAKSVEQSALRLAAILPGNIDSPSLEVRKREQAVLLSDKLAALPDDYRQVLILRNLEGRNFEEIGRTMNRTASAVRMLWLRAIEKLRNTYGNDDSIVS